MLKVHRNSVFLVRFILAFSLLLLTVRVSSGQERALQVADIWQQRAWLLRGDWEGTVSYSGRKGEPIKIHVDVTMDCFRGTIEFPEEKNERRRSRTFHVCSYGHELATYSFDPARGKFNLNGGSLFGGTLRVLGFNSREAAVTATLKDKALLIRFTGKDDLAGPVLRLTRSTKGPPLERKTEWIWRPELMIGLADKAGHYPVEIEGVLGLPESRRVKLQGDPDRKVLLEPYEKEDLDTGNYAGLIYRIRFERKPDDPKFEFRECHGQTDAEYEKFAEGIDASGFHEIYKQVFFDKKLVKRINSVWTNGRSRP